MPLPSIRRLFAKSHFPPSRHVSSSPFSAIEAFDPPPVVHTRRVVVTGLGMVTPLGCGVKSTWTRLIEGGCGIIKLTPEDLQINAFDPETQLHIYDQLTSKVAAVVPRGTKPGEFNEELWLNSKEHRSISRFIGYALCAADEALKDANWMPSLQEQKEKTGVSIGGGIGSISDVLDAAQLICDKLRRLSPFFIPRILINMASGHVSMKYGFQGPNHAAVTACATGAHSIGDAVRMIQFGDSDVMVAGGTESSIDALSIAGFCRSRALCTKYNSAPQEASRPFDSGRDGFVIGEGSGVMVLEELDHALKRGARIYAEVRGYGTSGDAHHITQPHASGRGAALAMTRAFKQSGFHPYQVDYLNAHATSTPLGDAVEATAIKSVFADHALSGALTFSSTKGAVGHLLGAAGAVEAIFSVLAIHTGVAPPSLNLKEPDPIFNDNFMPLTSSKQMPIRIALSNSFGFGGTNASLLFASAA
ncbi:3-oxoacyl-[acyl-carrier-protein] synthase, mitochondrial isoform X2 [Cucurbita maxima]|uniref:3-oxoacyl-[acyl-carrier-protein] synthase, mitochondrial n=1 Tax=Cucurbita maxima TaxID=3661 RepID=A0A6J1I6K9_CUCMA|nr:3-oxoacyl-[acyl-carrier-protein] synthase, mitochondrial isoform X2 [Cucurbita maxima]